jgi:2-phosphoglycerate kinase
MTTARRSEPLPLGGEDGLPFSKGRLARALMDAGVKTMRAYELALRVEDDLRRRGASSVLIERLEELAIEVLGEEEGRRSVGRLRRLGRLRALDIPIVVLLGGGTGTGKSTVATEVAHRLGITRVTSTDFIRQTMRAFFSPEFMPSVHYSSFEAGHALPAAEREAGDPLLLGFMDQTRHVLVGVKASIDRALEEGWSAVLEGVHLVPGMVSTPEARALVVHAVVAIEDENVHERHFTIRDTDSGGIRPHDKYVDRLGDIRQIQDFITEEARKEGVPVIEMGNIEQAIGAVLELVLDRAEQLQEVPT